MRELTLMATLLLGVGYPGRSDAADGFHVHSFEKIRLSDVFFSEGANYGDFDRDGAMDIVAGPYWYAGPGFEERHEYYAPKPFSKNGYSDNFFAWTDDLNGDGWQDIIVGGFPGQEAWWFENPHDPSSFGHSHWKRHTILVGLDNESPHYTDITGDGRRELVFHYKGQWGWAGPGEDPTQPWPFHAVAPKGSYQRFTHGMGVGDVNGDGRMDILEKGGWWEQPADLSAGEHWTKHEYDFTPHGYGGAQMYAYDFDGDGDNDVVSSSQAHAYGLYWFEQIEESGGISFRPHAIMDPLLGTDPKANSYGVVFSQMHALDLVDMDRDGIKDIVTGKRYWAHNGHDAHSRGMPVVYWFKTVRGPEGTDFVPFLIDGSAGVGTQVVAGDVNGDGWPDVVVGNKAGAFALIHRAREVDEAEYRRSFPRPYSLAKAGASPAGPPPATASEGIVPHGGELNLGFERGDLSGWTAEGDAFAGMPLKGDDSVVERRNLRAGVEGSYWIGTYEIGGDGPRGTLTSAPFSVTQPYASFLVGGGQHGSTCVEIVSAENGEVVFRASGADSEAMRRAAVDLRTLQGKTIFVRLVDGHAGPWGHINYDDFRFHAERPYIPPDQRLISRDTYPHAGLSGEEAARVMTLPYGFQATLFAAEPDVQQPIAFCIDDRGRLWVAEAYAYPIRRPDGEAKDRILIFEDVDGDGRFDERKVFAEGLNLVSGLEVGFGGVWVGAAPHLLFIPDEDADDIPDGDGAPRVLLDGWGYQDTHETLNSFIWGPDGWLYGCHGVFTHSRVGRPGAGDEDRVPLNAAIWRYHPVRHEFDVFCYGTSNPWGVDWNDLGQSFLTACVIPHLFQVIQGARYHRQGGRHFNPYVYDDIKTIADHRHYVGPNPHGGNDRSDSMGGGHAHCGAMVYLGDAWPGSYRNRLFMNNIHGQRVNVDRLVEKGSGYVGHHADDFLLTNDRWSQMLNLRYGPDGQVYLIDWYDQNACHHGRVDGHDRSNGRIYKVTYGAPGLTRVDLKLESDLELAELQLHENDWYVRHARRLLQERSARRPLRSAATSRLAAIAFEHAHETRRLRGLWALHATGNLTDELARRALDDYSPYVRAWAIQLILEDRECTEGQLARFEDMAAKDGSQVVRLYLASALQRLPHEKRWDVLASLLSHKEDATDQNLPLMYWYGAEPLAQADPGRALALAGGAQVPLVLSHMVRRIASEGSPEALSLIVKALGETDDASRQRLLVDGINTALKGRRRVPMPDTWPPVYSRLARTEDADLRAQLEALAVTFGDPAALASMRRLLEDREADIAARREALQCLLGAKDAQLASSLQALLEDPALRGDALRALATYDDANTPRSILAVYPDLALSEKRDALSTLASRASYADRLLGAIAAGRVPPADLSADIVRQLRNLRDPDVEKKVGEVWGIVRAVDRDKRAAIARIRDIVRRQPRPKVDLSAGRGIFVKTCQQCHALFGVGGRVGPELTGSNRADLDYILSNVVDPSSVLQNEYKPYVFVTADGRVVTGLIQGEDQNAYTIATANDTVVLPKDEIATMDKTDQSMMPEDLLAPFKDGEIRNLIAYLASPVQVPLKATADNLGTFFTGKDLVGWSGNEKLWSVENGELVGRSPGLEHNEFLRSELVLGDFRLRFKVKLTPNSGNSGVQFRSQSLPGGEVRGYQADVGQGWWGKLYEEHGRALLWDRSGEEHVRPEDWNDYEIVAEGSRIRSYINGHPCVDLDDPDGAREGIIALQIHSGPALEVRYRDFELELK